MPDAVNTRANRKGFLLPHLRSVHQGAGSSTCVPCTRKCGPSHPELFRNRLQQPHSTAQGDPALAAYEKLHILWDIPWHAQLTARCSVNQIAATAQDARTGLGSTSSAASWIKLIMRSMERWTSKLQTVNELGHVSVPSYKDMLILPRNLNAPVTVRNQ